MSTHGRGLPVCFNVNPPGSEEIVRTITRPRHAVPVRAWAFVDEATPVPSDFVMDLTAVLQGRHDPYAVEMFLAPISRTLARVSFYVERSASGQTWNTRRMFEEVFMRPRSFRMGHEAPEPEKMVRLRFSFREGPGEMRVRGVLHTKS